MDHDHDEAHERREEQREHLDEMADRQILEEILLGLGEVAVAVDEVLQYLEVSNQREGTMSDDFTALQAEVTAIKDTEAAALAALNAKDAQILDLLTKAGVDQPTIDSITADLAADNAALASAVAAGATTPPADGGPVAEPPVVEPPVVDPAPAQTDIPTTDAGNTPSV